MQIAGFIPSSLIDFPGRVAAVFFTPACNFRCPFCHNPDLALARLDGTMVSPTRPNPEPLTENEALTFLNRRRDRLGGVVVSGGEPTLQPDLAPFLERVRALGFAIKLDTNGSQPDLLAALLESNLLDMIAMDIKGPPALYPALTGLTRAALHWENIQESIALIAADANRRREASAGKPPEFLHEFRTTVMEPFFDETAIRNLRASLPPGLPWRLQNFTARHGTLDPGFTGREIPEALFDKLRAIAGS